LLTNFAEITFQNILNWWVKQRDFDEFYVGVRPYKMVYMLFGNVFYKLTLNRKNQFFSSRREK
jgi:hypothetical protein